MGVISLPLLDICVFCILCAAVISLSLCLSLSLSLSVHSYVFQPLTRCVHIICVAASDPQRHVWSLAAVGGHLRALSSADGGKGPTGLARSALPRAAPLDSSDELQEDQQEEILQQPAIPGYRRTCRELA